MKMCAVIFVAAFAIMGAVVGCGTGTPLDGALVGAAFRPSGATSLIDADSCAKWLAYAEAGCDRDLRCAGDARSSGEQCTKERAGWLSGQSFNEKVDARIEACTAELKAGGCAPTPSCAAVGRKTAYELGAACSTTRDCKVGLACIDDVCAERHGAGEACNYTSDDCRDGLSCQGKCQPVVDGATTCRSDDDCSTHRDAQPAYDLVSAKEQTVDLVCDDDRETCRAVTRGLARSQACGHGKICADGLFCKLTTRDAGTCEVPTKIGAKCTDGDGCPSCLDGTCYDPFKAYCGG